VEGQIGKLADDLALVPVELPGQQTWQAALSTAELLGITLGKALTPTRVDELAAIAKKKAAAISTKSIHDAIALLDDWLKLTGAPETTESTPRGATLVILRDLIACVLGAGDEPVRVVEALGTFAWDHARATAITGIAEPTKMAALVDTLRNENLRMPIAGGRNLELEPARQAEVSALMAKVRAALTQNENVEALRPALERESARITRLLFTKPPPPPPAPPPAAPPRTPDATPLDNLVPTAPTAPPTARAVAPRDTLGEPSGRPIESESAKAPIPMTVRSETDLEQAISEIRQQFAFGKQIRITIEILGGEKNR